MTTEVDMSRCFIAAIFLLFVAVAGAQTNTDSVTASNNTDQAQPARVFLPELELRGTTPIMFATLVREARFSGGVATSDQQCSHGQESSISVPSGTRFDIALGQLAGNKTPFEWKLRDGVVNLLPAGSVPPLLQVRIRRFAWDRATSVREVMDRLRQLPEVSEEALKLGLVEAPIEGGASAICIRGDCGKKPKPVSAIETEEGVTLLTVLNRIVRAHSGVVWSYSEYQCDKGALFSLDVLGD
jgi:hypothetical protein